VPLSKWADEDIKTKQHAEVVYERFRQAARDGWVATATETQGPLTFDQLADVYIDRYVKPRALRTAKAIEYRLKPLRAFFGSRQIGRIKTADVEDFIAEPRKRRRVNRQPSRAASSCCAKDTCARDTSAVVGSGARATARARNTPRGICSNMDASYKSEAS
jgi:hypothetical protein